jgi:cytoskeleton protein RodZ
VTDGTEALAGGVPPQGALDAGAMLRAGRESAGLSIAAVAQQLKLAPRQIVALEDGDFANLPGRTFIRGFVRNYARLLRLDSDAVLAALPETAAAFAQHNPSLAPTPRPMGELPADANAAPSPARWAIPLVLVAFVAVGAAYELTRSPAERIKATAVEKSSPPVAAAPASEPVATTAAPGATIALPNPLAPADEKSPATADNAAPATGAADAQLGTASPEGADMPLSLAFQGKSWVEVRDATGTLVLSTTGNSGDTQSVGGRPPLDVVLGNAAAVTVNWHGTVFDTTPFIRQNVAKFTLR